MFFVFINKGLDFHRKIMKIWIINFTLHIFFKGGQIWVLIALLKFTVLPIFHYFHVPFFASRICYIFDQKIS